jgi:hypothetical protein
VGIERVQGVHKENFVSSLEIRRASRIRHSKNYKILCGSTTRDEKKFPRGHKQLFEGQKG